MAVLQNRLFKPTVKWVGGRDHIFQDSGGVSGFNVNDHEVSLGRLLKTRNFFGHPKSMAALDILFPARTQNLRYGGFPGVSLARQDWSCKYC